MLVAIITNILTKLASWFVTKVLAYIHGRQEKAHTEEGIDQKLAAFKQAYKEAFDGTPVTPEQNNKLNQAISDFLRGDGTGL